MKNLRSLIIIIGIGIVFVLTALAAILIASGEIITKDGQIVKTGIIKISSKPDDVKVFVDGKEVTPGNDQITGLESGEYKIELTKNGYTKWEKTVEARPGVVVEIFAQLFPLEQNLNAVTRTNIDRVFYSENGEHAIYTVKSSSIGNDIGVWRTRLSQPTFSIIQNGPIKLSNMNSILGTVLNSDYEIEFSTDLRFILLQNKDTQEYYIMDAENYNEPDESLNETLGYTPDSVNWFRDSSSLIIQKDDLIFEYELESQSSTVISLTPDTSPVFGVNFDRVIFYNSNKDQLEVYERGKSKKLEVLNTSLPKEITNIHLTKEDHKFVLLETEKDLYYLNTEKSFLDKITENAEVIEFAPDGQGVLLSINNQLYSYTVKEFISENRIVPTLKLVNTEYNGEKQVKWSGDSKHIIELNETTKEIKVYDEDGGNINSILKDERIANFDIYIPLNSASIYILMNDELKNDDANQKIRTNLYEIKLAE